MPGSMRRTKSSLLGFNLREFIQKHPRPLESESAASSWHSRQQLPSTPPSTPPPPGMYTGNPSPPPTGRVVWVDCQFFGFYIDESRKSEFSDALNFQSVPMEPP